LFIEGVHGTTREVQSQVKPFVSKGEIEPKVERRRRVLAIADGALIHPVDDAVTIKVFVLHVAGTQRTVTLAVVVDWPAFNFFPALELPVRLQTPVQVAIPLYDRIAVHIPRVAKARLVTVPVIKTGKRNVTRQ